MKVLVTGANGHIGCHIVRSLLERGHEVRGLVRPTSDLRGLTDVDVELFRGNVMDPDSVDAAVEDCEVVFHAAAVFRMWAKDESEILAPAMQGAENVIGACMRHGVRRLVYTSSTNSIGFSSRADLLRSEQDWNDKGATAYVRAKLESEKFAVKLAEEQGVEMVVTLPALVLGPHDYRVTPSTQIVRDVVLRKMPAADTGLNIVHVADVAEGHVLAAEKGRPGERYILGGDNITGVDLAARLAKLTGGKPTMKAPPKWMLRAMVPFAAVASKLTGKEPIVTHALIDDFIGTHAVFDVSKAKSELDYHPRGADETLEDTVRWLVHTGELTDAAVAGLSEKFAPAPGWA